MILRRAKLPVILVANKVDNSAEYYQAAEFYKLGLGDPQCISAATVSYTHLDVYKRQGLGSATRPHEAGFASNRASAMAR